MKAGLDIPERVMRSMNVWPHLQQYDEAFRRLSAGRGWWGTMAGASPIRIAEAEKWSYAHGRGLAQTPDEYERFVRVIDRLDDEYMAWQARQVAGQRSANDSDATDDVDEDDQHDQFET